MKDTETLLAILDTINHPIVFVDNNHIIRYLNKPAEKRYYDKRGYPDLVGKSLFDCHKPESNERVREIHDRMKNGEDEIFLKVSSENENLTVIAVRDKQGALIGYYERFEKID